MRRKSIKSIVLAGALIGSTMLFVAPANSQVLNINCFRDPYLPDIEIVTVDTTDLDAEKKKR